MGIIFTIGRKRGLLYVTVLFSTHAASCNNTLLNRVRPLGKSLIMSIVKTNSVCMVGDTYYIINASQLAMPHIVACISPPLIILLC